MHLLKRKASINFNMPSIRHLESPVHTEPPLLQSHPSQQRSHPPLEREESFEMPMDLLFHQSSLQGKSIEEHADEDDDDDVFGLSGSPKARHHHAEKESCGRI